MRFRVLGPVEVDDGAASGALAGKPRALLALLLLHANDPVPVERIVDGLWGEAVPASAAKMLHGIVSRLRRALPHEVLQTRAGGYLVQVEPGALDLHRFEALTREAAAADDPREAAELLREALALWRGAPLAGVREPFAQAEAARLEELRIFALEQRIDADLACGRHAELLGELETLVRREPLRERLHGQLMLALYRAGRQADALARYHAFRRELDEQLGITPPERLRELEQGILTHDPELSAPPQHIAEPRVELPAPLDSFVGRERDLRALAELIARDDVRLLTLTGPGGVGKTRLALELAQTAAGAFADGVRFVPLVAVSNPDQVLSAIAFACGLRQEENPFDTVAAELGDARTLLVLDNFEHVLDAAPAVAELLRRASGASALVTSRAPLGVRGEREWAVAPLALAGEDVQGAESDAVRLFAERAAAVRRGFRVTPAARELCLRLDGLPLAIELAAAQTRSLSPEALLDRLGSRLDLPMAGTPSDLPERQRTLRATIDWSHDLLDEPARALFARFAIFVGGATLDAVDAVCGAQLEQLRMVHDHSLVRLDDDERYTMLETIRQYALERLHERGEHDAIAAAHAAYVRELAHTGGIDVRGPGEQSWSARLEAEMPNVRAAIAWLQRAGRHDDVIRIAVDLWPFLWPHGHGAEGHRWLTTALESEPRIDSELRRQALATAATLAWTIGGREPEAERLARAALDARPDGPDDGFAALARGVHALLAASRGDLEHSIRIGEAVEATFRHVGDPWNALVTSILIARTQAAAGHPDRGRMAANVTAARRLSRYLLSAALIDIGSIQLADGDRAHGRASLEEALTIGDALGSPIARARALLALAALASADGNARRCATLLAAAARIRTTITLALTAPETSRHDALAAGTRDTLGPDAYAAAWQHGTAMPTRHAVAYALART